MAEQPVNRLTAQPKQDEETCSLWIISHRMNEITLTRAQRRAWIEIQLMGEDDRPVPHEPYEITLPDGSCQKDCLNNEGFARIADIPPGECKVIFPRIDQNDWELPPLEDPSPRGAEALAAAKIRPTGDAWLELELKDDDGKPLAKEPFIVNPPEGDPIKGKLNKDGFARIENLVPGICRVTFPNIDRRAWEVSSGKEAEELSAVN